jgi:DNA-binding PadR family transcriptional regulator
MEHLGELEQLVMLAVVQLGDDAYGAEIQRELAERAKRRVSLGTIYVTLTRLEGKGMVRSWLGDPTPARGGKARRHFAVERAGMTALRTSREALARMWEGLSGGGRSASGSHARS